MMTVSSLHEESPMSTATEFGMSPEDAPDSKPPHARNGAATDSGGSSVSIADTWAAMLLFVEKHTATVWRGRCETTSHTDMKDLSPVT